MGLAASRSIAMGRRRVYGRLCAATLHWLETEEGMPPRLRLDLARATLGCSGLILTLTVLLGVSVLSGDRALASHVGCGETITTDTTLDSDLVDCPNHGIVIGADGVTLDLNGHVIEGDGARFAHCRPRGELCDIGVLNEGHDGVTVRNGSVRAFDTGVLVAESRENRIVGISSSRNRLFGFVVGEAARSVIRDSAGNDNPVPDGDGIGVFGSRRVRILDNSFRRNALGMHVADSSEVLIKGNVVSRNRTEGIKLEGSRNQVRGNRCARNSACVSVDRGNRNVIAVALTAPGYSACGTRPRGRVRFLCSRRSGSQPRHRRPRRQLLRSLCARQSQQAWHFVGS
jgi:parallel beta-helix repeat protein